MEKPALGHPRQGILSGHTDERVAAYMRFAIQGKVNLLISSNCLRKKINLPMKGEIYKKVQIENRCIQNTYQHPVCWQEKGAEGLKGLGRYFLFFMFFIALYWGMNYFVFWNLMQVIPQGLRGLTALIFWLMGSAFVVSQLIKRRVKLPRITYFSGAWMGFLGIGITIYSIALILKGLLPRFSYGLDIIAAILVGFCTLFSLLWVARGPRIKEVTIPHEKIKGEPLNLVMLSDVHLGIMTSKQWLERIVEQVNDLNPDLIVITGDLIDDAYELVADFAPIMAQLKGRLGVYAVAGNHEHYQGIDAFYRFLNAAKIQLLHNESKAIEQRLNIIGIDDLGVNRGKKGLGKHFDTIKGNCHRELFNLLLIHQPVGFRLTAKEGVDLQLSGHTHRGQVPPMNPLIYLFYPDSYGLKKYGQSYLYITSGTGTWGPPMRLFSDSEIVKITLQGSDTID